MNLAEKHQTQSTSNIQAAQNHAHISQIR